ncbi:glycosyltransferase [Nocardioides mangrovicus]|uniref:Glycosyltransferase n=1 Tax=Nocardioides mangrovicus TaxID=2478913 RepID=A0A3L8P4Z3_9ACTN|nr:glycosyltransferase [Nocardioides mangrovicus]RLV49833.1 glycosyltransferase [Nocardioides mangrovicus]
MFIAILELRHTITQHAHLYLFSIFVVLTWLVWWVKVMLSRRYRPWRRAYTVSTSVVIPVVDEPLELFRDVLRRITEQRPDETVVVINGPVNVALQEVCEEFAPAVRWTWTPVAGKRNAVRVGVEATRGDVVVLVDSDTVWTPHTLRELVKPFAEPDVGGVTTRQRILEPERCFLTRWADWLENTRALYSMPAQSVLGTVGCLPGRTIAFRRDVLEDSMEEFMTARFLGIFLEVSDDRTLTNLALKRGFRTVYQATSLVYTDAPTRVWKMMKQQLRWARGSQYNTLRMLPWMSRRARVLAFFFVCDIVMPFLLITVITAWAIRLGLGTGENLYAGLLHMPSRSWMLPAIIAFTVLLSTLSMTLRQLRHIEDKPSDLLWMPLYIVFSTLFLMPLRAYGFLRLGHVGGWGTRTAAYSVDTDDRSTGADGSAVVAGGAPRTGDPRALVPYLIATALVTLGVMFDAQLF